jgi:LacI family transcriptional regulator
VSVTMADVAREADVNKATVSRVLRGDPRISPATRRRVWEVVRRLGYAPNVVAKGLSSRRTDVVGVVLPSLALPWTGELLSGMGRVLSKRGIDLLPLASGEISGSRARALRILKSRGVDGALWLDGLPEEEPDFPLVTLGQSLSRGSAIIIDEPHLARELLARSGPAGIRLFQGPLPLFPGLAECIPEPADPERALPLYDGLLPRPPLPERAILCGEPAIAAFMGWPAVPWPAFDIGVLAGRLLFNLIRDQGSRPGEIRITPAVVGS